jgi:hypothetical protein
VVNENDTVAVQVLRFGDNDTLSAQVATLVQADWLFLLTDVRPPPPPPPPLSAMPPSLRLLPSAMPPSLRLPLPPAGGRRAAAAPLLARSERLLPPAAHMRARLCVHATYGTTCAVQVDCLYSANPKDDPAATPIWEVEDISALTADTSTKGTQWGTGGMATKLTAGRIATAAGTTMVICNSDKPENIAAVLAGAPRIGTKFHPLTHALHGRKRWVVAVPVRGHLWLDAGAVAAVRDRHKSLFSAGACRRRRRRPPPYCRRRCAHGQGGRDGGALRGMRARRRRIRSRAARVLPRLSPPPSKTGILRVQGKFSPQDAVAICDEHGAEFARGLCNFTSEEVTQMRGKSSRVALEELGYATASEVVHRDNLALLTASGAEEVPDGAYDTEDGIDETASAADETDEDVPMRAVMSRLSADMAAFATMN